VISKLERKGVGPEVALFAQIGLLILTDIMIKKYNRDDKRDVSMVIIANDLKEFLFFVWR
jgi:hypothetical protein